MSVTNRKMFRKSDARNRLRQMGGIMSSSPELMQTVQKFNVGGNVSLAEMQQANDPRFFNRLGANIANLPAAAYDTAVGFPASTLQNAATAFQFSPFGRAMGLSEPGQERPPYVGAQPAQTGIRDVMGANQPLTPEQVALRNQPPGIGVLAPPQDQATSDQLGQDVFGEFTLPEQADPFVMPGIMPSPETRTADQEPAPEKSPVVEPAPAPAPASTSKDVQAAKRGELGAAEQVKAVVAQGTPEEQRNELGKLMAEFTENAPEYEGTSKGLAIAKIGFAMAAGQSPNAITNIANAMSEGADSLIKDKRERDAFNRQVKLSALQYGLGEVGKQRAEDRLAEREGRELTYWVADSDGSFNGQSFKKNQTVAVPTSYILEKGVPEGLGSVEMAKAALETSEAVQKALIEASEKAQEGQVLKASDYRKNAEIMNNAATNFASKQTLEELLTKQILNVSEGQITGVKPAFESVVNKAASAVGVDLGKQYENLEQYDADMRRVSNQMVNELLGEGSKTLSDFDRKLAQEIVGYYSGQGGYVFRDPDVLLDRLQNTLSDVQKAQRTSLNTMKDITDATAGLVHQTGKPVQFRSALSVAGPFLNETQAQNFNLVQGDDGVFRVPQ